MRAWLSRTVTRSSGKALCCAYRRNVMDVQAPSPASRRSYGPGPLSRPPTAIGSSARNLCLPAVISCWKTTFRMFGSCKNVAGVFDAVDCIGRRMEDEQRLAPRSNALCKLMFGDILEECVTNAKGPARQRNLDLATGRNRIELALEEAGDMCRVTGSADGYNRARFRHS